MTDARLFRRRYRDLRVVLCQPNEVIEIFRSVLTLISSYDCLRDSYPDFVVFTNAAGRISEHRCDVGLAIGRGTNR